tara:strand:+ start:42 stop:536 length:495 start_codon:yes stop_codon:yes gene_type:complete
VDSDRTKIKYLDKSIFDLTARLLFTSVFYFLIIKKIILYFFNTFILPHLISLNDKYSELKFEILGDDIIINSPYESFQRVSINLPFSLYYFFFIALIYPKIFRTDFRYVHFYNLALFIIQPLLIFFLIKNFPWSDNLIRVHEIGYKVSFLALGMYVYSNGHKAI